MVIAVTKFMYWLKHTIGTCDMTEMTAAHKIEELRAEQGNYIEPSFVTIAAQRKMQQCAIIIQAMRYARN